MRWDRKTRVRMVVKYLRLAIRQRRMGYFWSAVYWAFQVNRGVHVAKRRVWWE